MDRQTEVRAAQNDDDDNNNNNQQYQLSVQQRPVVVDALIAQHPIGDAAAFGFLGGGDHLLGGLGHQPNAVLVDGRLGDGSGAGEALGSHGGLE